MKSETRYNIAIVVAVAALVSAFAASAAPTANEDYVDRQDAQTYTNAVTDANAYTDSKLDEAKAYTDSSIAGVGNVSPSMVTNISGKVTSNVVNKAYVESLGIEAGISEQRARQIANDAASGKLDSLARDGWGVKVASGNSTNDLIRFNNGDVNSSSLSIGLSAGANGESSTAIGNASNARSNYAVAIGGGNANSAFSTSIGIGSTTLGDYSLAFGFGSLVTGFGSVAIGSANQVMNNPDCAVAIGRCVRVVSDRAVSIGSFETVTELDHGEGSVNFAPVGGINNFWIGSKCLAEYLADATPSDYNTVKANAAAGASAAGQVAQLNLGYTRLYNFSTGATNANFTATNYPPTKAEADARCHFEPEPGMDFSKVPSSLQLNEYRDGEWRTVVDTRSWPVWYFKFKERQLTNEIARLKAENAALSNRVEAAKSWADRTANGIDNPMTDTVVVDRPNMWIMADYEWQKVVSASNQCFVIRAKNVALSGGGNTNGFLEVVDAFGKPYMRINKTAETFAEPIYQDIYFDDDEGAWYVVFSNSTKPTKGGANIALRGNGDGKCILFEETDPECPAVITWPDVAESHSGHWIMKAVPKPVNGVIPKAMFLGAEIKVHGSDYVEYLKEASFGAGIRYGNNVYQPQESGNQLIFVKRND